MFQSSRVQWLLRVGKPVGLGALAVGAASVMLQVGRYAIEPRDSWIDKALRWKIGGEYRDYISLAQPLLMMGRMYSPVGTTVSIPLPLTSGFSPGMEIIERGERREASSGFLLVRDRMQEMAVSWLQKWKNYNEVEPVSEAAQLGWFQTQLQYKKDQLGRPIHTEVIRGKKGLYPVNLPGDHLPDMIVAVFAVSKPVEGQNVEVSTEVDPYQFPEQFQWLSYMWVVDKDCYLQFSRKYPEKMLDVRQKLLQGDHEEPVKAYNMTEVYRTVKMFKQLPRDSRGIVLQLRDQMLEDYWRLFKAVEAKDEEVVQTLGMSKLELAGILPLEALRAEVNAKSSDVSKQWSETMPFGGHTLVLNIQLVGKDSLGFINNYIRSLFM